MLKRKESEDRSEVDATNTLDDAPQWFQNQMYAEAVANTQAMNQLRLAIVAKAVEAVLNPSPGTGTDPTVMMALIEKLGDSLSPNTDKRDMK